MSEAKYLGLTANQLAKVASELEAKNANSALSELRDHLESAIMDLEKKEQLMAMATFKCEFPRRQAMLIIFERVYPWQNVPSPDWKPKEIARVPVFVWPMPTQDGCFIVEHQDGHCQKVQPHELTFLDSKELFDQYMRELGIEVDG